ncbi:hypothetical protein EJ08DRAFT_634594 [Tothia fuscella]|uniref:Uncharacterized protein n=1 Tax=Tothia fuscella TaxID=1048955 RepID=A0A9P4NQF4_9PEZI|nr:hypothetical protein EJ08DRAFT_634594 [Tothia fuscella]
MAPTTPKIRSFNPRPTSLPTNAYDAQEAKEPAPEVESPSLSTPSARARFEFEPGKNNADGTKILMVEWEEDEITQRVDGSWIVSWEGKSHVLPAEGRKEGAPHNLQAQSHRLFFLLPPGITIPTTVTLILRPKLSPSKKIIWKTNPLPAIFPPGLYDPAINNPRQPSNGVLHTLWAKKRLQTLQTEIEREIRDFPEGVGLEMALKEKEWIQTTFSIDKGTTSTHRISLKEMDHAPLSPIGPLSPGGSRLAEKLKGLTLQTGDAEPRRRDSSQAAIAGAGRGILSPEDDDIAVPSFSAFRGAHPDVLAAKPVQPSSSIEEEGELFAMPLSPRSPEMTKSPFSFANTDTGKYLKDTGAQTIS